MRGLKLLADAAQATHDIGLITRPDTRKLVNDLLGMSPGTKEALKKLLATT